MKRSPRCAESTPTSSRTECSTTAGYGLTMLSTYPGRCGTTSSQVMGPTRKTKEKPLPASWSEERIKQIVKETVCDPDFKPDTSPDEFLQRRRKGYEGEIVEVLRLHQRAHLSFPSASATPPC